MIERFSTQVSSPQLRNAISDGIHDNQKATSPLKGNENTQTNKDEVNESEAVQQKVQEADKQKIQEAVKGLNQFLQPSPTSIHFEYHEKLDEYYVKVIDDQTDETIREIPSKKLLDMYAKMLDFVGLMVDEKI